MHGSPEPGRWSGNDGRLPSAFDGCVVIDFAAAPFTDPLPVRRPGAELGTESTKLAMLYVSHDTLVPYVDEQCCCALETGRRYRYEAADRSFAADLPVDADGLVTDYPTLFERL